MISRKHFSVFNFKILFNKIITKSNFVCLLRERNHDKNGNNNNAILTMKSYCTIRGNNISSPEIINEKKPLMSKKNRETIDKWLETCKSSGIRVPKQISEEQFQELFQASSRGKIKYLNYLVKREAAKLKDKVNKKRKIAEQEEERRNSLKGHIDYGLWKNSMFAKCKKGAIKDLNDHRICLAIQFGQPLIIDLGFEEHMKGREVTSYANQLVRTVSVNRSNNGPFNLMFCNVDFDAKGFNKFKKIIPNILKPSCPMTFTSESYLDLFPKEKLVYLSPDADETLETFSHDAVYIIGGIVDLGRADPLSLAKAERENIKMQKLPIDNYHIFKGSKRLGIHIMTGILLEVQKDGDWKKAFRMIPKRLLQIKEESEHKQ